MALTKTEAGKLTQDLMLRGVIDTIVRDSQLLAHLPFEQVVGTAVTYNREALNPNASFYDPLDTWAESTPTFTQHTAPLRILGGDADVDNFLQQSYSDPNNLEAEVLIKRAKATSHLYQDAFYNGDVAFNPKSFDGLSKILTAIPAQEHSLGANGGALTIDAMDILCDLLPGGRPDALLMSKRSRRKLSSLRRASGVTLESSVDQFGQHAVAYDGIPILVDDFIPNAQVQGASSVTSSIYAVRWGMDGVCGLESGSGIQVVEVGDLETKDATRWRVKWYASLAVFSDLGIARIRGILP